MAYTLENIHQYGYAPIGNLEEMIKEAITQLATLGKTRQEIAEILGVSRDTVCRKADEHGIQIQRQKHNTKLNQKTVTEFEKLLAANLSISQIANIWDCDVKSVYNWMDRNNMKAARRKAILTTAKGAAR